MRCSGAGEMMQYFPMLEIQIYAVEPRGRLSGAVFLPSEIIVQYKMCGVRRSLVSRYGSLTGSLTYMHKCDLSSSNLHCTTL
jgi:hypothetical protein